MAWLAVDEDGSEWIIETRRRLRRMTDNRTDKGVWDIFDSTTEDQMIYLPKGSIEKLIGKKLSWTDEPVELKED